MLRSEIEKLLKTNKLVKGMRLGDGSGATVSKAAKSISSGLHQLKSNISQNNYLKKAFGLESDERKKIFGALQPKVDMEKTIKTVQGFRDDRSRMIYLKKSGFSSDESRKIMREAEPRRVSEYLKAKEDSVVGYKRETGIKRNTSTLGISAKGVGDDFDGSAKFAERPKTSTGFAGNILNKKPSATIGTSSGNPLGGGNKPIGM